jgi:hypothetical protein
MRGELDVQSTKGVLAVEAKGNNGGLDLASVPEVKGHQIRSVGGCGGSLARGNPDTTLSARSGIDCNGNNPIQCLWRGKGSKEK